VLGQGTGDYLGRRRDAEPLGVDERSDWQN